MYPWNPLKHLAARKPARRQPISKTQLELEVLEARVVPATDVLTYHYDTASTGVNPTETALSTANVQVNSFGKLYAVNVDGQVYAEPLVKTGVTIGSGPNTLAGAGTVHDVVFVATQHDSL